MNYPIRPLSELCNIVIGRTPARKENRYWGKGNKWVSISDLKSKVICETKEEITNYAVKHVRCRKVPKGTILFSFKLTIGKMAFAGCDLYTNEAIAALLIKNKEALDATYLFLALKAANFVGSNQAVMGKTLNSKSLAQIEIPLPPPDEQKRIAYLLGKVEGAIAQRKQHLQQLDDLLKIIFLDLFGFLDDSFKDWNRDKLASHTGVVSGATKGKKYKEANLIEVPYMRVANVQDRYFDLSEIKTIPVTLREIEKYRLQKGDLLLTEGGDPDKLGRGSVWENQIDDCIHQNHIFRVRIDNLLELNPYYLSALVSSQYGKAYFLKSAKQTTGIASINSTQLKNFPVLIPPIDLQNKFAAIIKKVEYIKSSYQKSLADLENLYGSLSQEAFKGKLDLSRVPLTLESIEAVEDTNTTYTQQQAADTATLPAPSVLTALTSSKSRNAFIKQWLIVWLDLLNDEPFSSNLFMLATQQRLSELAEDESIEIGIEEYDQLRDWLFYDIQRGQLEQKLNKVTINDEQEPGNRVILNKTIQR